MMDYLNQDHPALRGSKDLRLYAVRELLDRSLKCSRSFLLQFDSMRLKDVIGEEDFQKLMPSFGPVTSWSSSKYDIYGTDLNDSRIELLRRILSPEPEGYPELPLNYIKSVRLHDRVGKTVLRGGDHNSFILFSLPESEYAALVETYRRRKIPGDVIEKVDVDVENLEP
jgi:hypothetical protein